MKVVDYHAFVRRTDQSKGRSRGDRRSIALYGLVGEIGSVISAVKKKLLGEAGADTWDQPNEEIVEELGDLVWYCVSLSQIQNDPTDVNILTSDIALLKAEIGGPTERAKKIHTALDPKSKDEFLAAAGDFPNTKDMTFDHYQKLAFLTARTERRILLEVCLAVLAQLGAELLREKLPPIELELNKNVADRPVNILLGEIAWHLSAVASIMKLSLNEVVSKNVEKVSFRSDRDTPTPLHDGDRDDAEKFPRRFEIAIISLGPKKSRMYFRGKPLGDDLTDNAREDDGYRFHDVLHLATVAHLGWSPVVRKLMGKKRKSRNDQADEVEDGARAIIVDEVIQKAVHSEGVRLAQEAGPVDPRTIVRTFPARSSISFRFLKTLRTFVEGLEVSKNQYWEWEGAIFEGAEAYFQLRTHKQGTITVDLDNRRLSFSPDVCVDLKGVVVGFGSTALTKANIQASAKVALTQNERDDCAGDEGALRRSVAAKRSILSSLGVSEPQEKDYANIETKIGADGRVYVKAMDEIRVRMWDLKAVSFRLSVSESPDTLQCFALALGDVADAGR